MKVGYDPPLPISNFPFSTFPLFLLGNRSGYAPSECLSVSCGLHLYLLSLSSAGNFLEGDLDSWPVLSLLGAGVGDIGVEVEDLGKNTVGCSWKTEETRCIDVCTSQCSPAPMLSRFPLLGTPSPRVLRCAQVVKGECYE